MKAKGKGDLITFWFKKSNETVLSEPCNNSHSEKIKLQMNELELTERNTGDDDESTHPVI